jgi:hypothetical protein
MVDIVWLIAAVVLTGSTVTATILMAVNFPQIHRAQRAVLASLNGLNDNTTASFNMLITELSKLEKRVQALEDTHG